MLKPRPSTDIFVLGILLSDAVRASPRNGRDAHSHAFRDGVLQPFRFVALGDDDHRNLRSIVDSVADRSFLGIRSTQWTTPKSH